ncbi:MAG: hypothetical protein IKY43_04080 [Bacteroidales bacterium]|jgi:F0F1-type ATP synthase membrane subunit c/vacuolar-type H+-ATPase subunit K|nr:hypothetical protein [Bacteroidales bacterium]
MKEVFKYLLLVTAVVLAATSVYALVGESQYFMGIWFGVAIYFAVFTGLVCYAAYKVLKKNPKQFVSIFMLISFVQVILHIVVLFLYITQVKEGIKSFFIYFCIMYVVYMITEVVMLIKMSKRPIERK